MKIEDLYNYGQILNEIRKKLDQCYSNQCYDYIENKKQNGFKQDLHLEIEDLLIYLNRSEENFVNMKSFMESQIFKINQIFENVLTKVDELEESSQEIESAKKYMAVKESSCLEQQRKLQIQNENYSHQIIEFEKIVDNLRHQLSEKYENQISFDRKKNFSLIREQIENYNIIQENQIQYEQNLELQNNLIRQNSELQKKMFQLHFQFLTLQKYSDQLENENYQIKLQLQFKNNAFNKLETENKLIESSENSQKSESTNIITINKIQSFQYLESKMNSPYLINKTTTPQKIDSLKQQLLKMDLSPQMTNNLWDFQNQFEQIKLYQQYDNEDFDQEKKNVTKYSIIVFLIIFFAQIQIKSTQSAYSKLKRQLIYYLNYNYTDFIVDKLELGLIYTPQNIIDYIYKSL